MVYRPAPFLEVLSVHYRERRMGSYELKIDISAEVDCAHHLFLTIVGDCRRGRTEGLKSLAGGRQRYC